MLDHTLQSFCQHILQGSNPPEAHARILCVKSYKTPAKLRLRHEFVTIQAVVRGLPEDKVFKFWLRVDRAGLFDAKVSTDQSSSILTPNDKVRF